ncbi:MAG TPA: hypothetical protein VMZ26_10665 [Pyrinomonadaceae bacterium]|nr:hypothetical protein [Pyrinomonadaceae bacterium]
MQNPSAIRTRSKAAAVPAGELSWSFMLLVIVCACVVAAGFFFAARQHFTSMDYGIKNSRLREQLQDLQTEKRRLLLAREVASSPIGIRKAATAIGLRESYDVAAVQVSGGKGVSKVTPATVVSAKPASAKSSDTNGVIRTVLTAPVQPKASGETRGRIAEPSKEKRDKTEVAALLKFR